MRKFLTALFLTFAAVNFIGATRVGLPVAMVPIHIENNHTVDSASDDVVIRVHDKIKWTGLGRTDDIVRLPSTFNETDDPCTTTQAVYGEIADEFTGPTHFGVPGVFVRGPGGDGDAGGPEIVDPFTCVQNPNGSYPTGVAGCCDIDSAPTVVGTRAYCGGQSGVEQYIPDEIWDYPWLGGQLLIIEWPLIELCDADADDLDDACWDWTRLDHEFQAAAESGKFISFSIKTGSSATPDWLFDPPVNAVEVNLKGNNSNSFGGGNCGQEATMGSPFDPAYVTEINEFIEAFFRHLDEHPAWRNRLASWQLMGVGAGSDEFKTYKTCEDGDHNGVLDTINGDECFCNSKIWAEAGWTATAIADFVSDQVHLVDTLSGGNVVVKYPLIQAGLPKIKDETNYEGDTLFDTDGVTRLCPTCVSTDNGQQVSSADQVDGIIAAGKARAQNSNGFWAMHFGLGPYPTESFNDNPAATNCSWGGTVDLANERIEFPIPLVGPVKSESQCPNPWATSTTISPPAAGMSGFQTNNSGNGVDDPAAVESTFLNLLRNTNAIYEEIYTQLAFYIHELVGDDGDMNPDRDVVPLPAGLDPELFTKSVTDYVSELTDRRDGGTFTEPDVFPSTWIHQFDTAGTYYFYVPASCPAVGNGSWGKILVTP